MHTVRRVKNVVSYLAAVVIGCALLVGGVVTLGDSGSGKVMCGNREMHPGDTCTTTRKGKTTERSYDEQKESNGWTPWILFGIGGLLAVGGAVMLIGEFKRSPGGGGGGSNGPGPGMPPQFPPNQPYPQPGPQYGYAPNYVAPQGYAAPQGYPAPPQYGPPPGYGAPPQGYPQPGCAPPGYPPQQRY
ncbi:hypothetical protein [Nocardia crassostreae]|uniref:hypothetical protein n=1 Tax=Nocardia crassostreae TaxID=53428 RepID=UPI00082A9431|nr:hypothetical protein [Nocardia crassostreae]